MVTNATLRPAVLPIREANYDRSVAKEPIYIFGYSSFRDFYTGPDGLEVLGYQIEKEFKGDLKKGELKLI